MQTITKTKGDYLISTDKTLIDLKVVHAFLTNDSYWAKNISLDKVRRAVEHSLNFSLFYKRQQIGYARVISDFATIAYLGDVFILAEHSGKNSLNGYWRQ